MSAQRRAFPLPLVSQLGRAAGLASLGVMLRSTDRIRTTHVIVRFAERAGRENVVASADCGFSSQATYTPEIHPTIVWAKFEALAEGARRATARLW